MKRFIGLIVLALVGVAAANAQQANSWVYLVTSSTGDVIYTASKVETTPEGTKKLWVKRTFASGKHQGQTLVMLVEYNCNGGYWGWKFTYYAPDGSVVRSGEETTRGAWETYGPGDAIGRMQEERACR